MPRRERITIQGAVQGVGFRPFAYRLATGLGLSGFVLNDARGVVIEVEGAKPEVEAFLRRLPAEAPPRAVIHSLAHEAIAPAGGTDFAIRRSEPGGEKSAAVLPDIATCGDCLQEIQEAADRRRNYPFTNCTNCGPRFSIIMALPYDRPRTTMARFTMCRDCRSEYDDPGDRRFHAQPNACPSCGPSLELWDAAGAVLERGDAALRAAAAILRDGRVLAAKGLGGFHLMADARDGAAVARLRARKHRYEKPLALMARDLEQARRLCDIPPAAAEALAAPEAPILLLRRRAGAPVCDAVAPGNPNLGVMLPATPLHHLLMRRLGFPVVATSGNLSDEPICTDEREAVRRLGGIADRFLVHDRPIARHVDDSVAWHLRGAVRLIRRARGFAPLPVRLPRPLPAVLAVGAHLKNTVALATGDRAFLSQHIGDLETPEAGAAFERVIADFLRLYDARPVAVAHDLHPDYDSSRFARAAADGKEAPATGEDGVAAERRAAVAALRGARLVAVQHHHAHLAACLADNGADGAALGVTWDGAGLGTDGTVWGGEFLVGSATGYARVATFRPFRLPGGDAAAREPRRAALGLLWEIDGERSFANDGLAPIRAFAPAEKEVLGRMLERRVNAPVCSSAGRLFDAVASLCGLTQRAAFEGQAAMMLEFAADPAETGAYPLPLRESAGHPGAATTRPDGGRPGLVLDWEPLMRSVIEDVRRGAAPGVVSARFHNALAEAIAEVARRVGERRVALTGGCFQNRRLTETAAARLEEAGFEVLLHRQVPPNDGGISLGQAVVAGTLLAGA